MKRTDYTWPCTWFTPRCDGVEGSPFCSPGIVGTLHQYLGNLIGKLHGPALGNLQHRPETFHQVQADHRRRHFRPGDIALGMLFMKLLTNRAQIFADVRTFWSPEATKRASGYELTGAAKENGGFIHLINSGSSAEPRDNRS